MKLQVLVNDDLTPRLDKLAKFIGVSRSALCASIIVKSLPEWEEVYTSKDVSTDTQIEYEQLKIQ